MPFVRPLTLLLLVLCAAPLAAQEPPEATPPGEITPQLFATGLAPASSIAFDRAGNAYLANYRRPGVVGRILVDGTAGVLCDLAEASPLENRSPRIACLRIDVEGRVLVADAGGGRLLRISNDGSRVEILADRHEGERFTAVEAVALDHLGNIYFTDLGPEVEEPETDSEEAPEDVATEPETATATGVLYRFDIQTGKVTLLDRGLEDPAGLAVSPDQSKLVLAESTADRLLIYQLSPQREVSERRVLATWTPEEQEPHDPDQPIRFGPAGMAFDRAGLLYVTLSVPGKIEVIDLTEGAIAATYDAGGPGASDCHFQAGDLYIAVAPKEAVFRLPLAVDGFDYCGQ